MHISGRSVVITLIAALTAFLAMPALAQSVDPNALANAIGQSKSSVMGTGTQMSGVAKVLIGFVAIAGVAAIAAAYMMSKYSQGMMWKWVGGVGVFLIGSLIIYVVFGVQ